MKIISDNWKTRLIGQHHLGTWTTQWRNTMRERDNEFDPSHRSDHLQRVVNNVFQLIQHEPGELAILLPAAWLHDYIPVDKRSAKRGKASQLAAKHAIDFLRQSHYPSAFYDAIAHAIEAHSFSAGIPTTTHEARLLHDADRLDSLGAVGLARVMMLGGQFGNALYHPTDPFAQHRALNDKHYIVDHFYAKLLQLPSTMQTHCGRLVAQQRQQYLLDYLTQLASELNV